MEQTARAEREQLRRSLFCVPRLSSAASVGEQGSIPGAAAGTVVQWHPRGWRRNTQLGCFLPGEWGMGKTILL